jgi:hypothetical protein
MHALEFGFRLPFRFGLSSGLGVHANSNGRRGARGKARAVPHGALVEDRHAHRLQLLAHQVGLLVLQLLAEPPPPRE